MKHSLSKQFIKMVEVCYNLQLTLKNIQWNQVNTEPSEDEQINKEYWEQKIILVKRLLKSLNDINYIQEEVEEDGKNI